MTSSSVSNFSHVAYKMSRDQSDTLNLPVSIQDIQLTVLQSSQSSHFKSLNHQIFIWQFCSAIYCLAELSAIHFSASGFCWLIADRDWPLITSPSVHIRSPSDVLSWRMCRVVVCLCWSGLLYSVVRGVVKQDGGVVVGGPDISITTIPSTHTHTHTHTIWFEADSSWQPKYLAVSGHQGKCTPQECFYRVIERVRGREGGLSPRLLAISLISVDQMFIVRDTMHYSICKHI